mgnify:CR=1 FL=1
MYTSFICTVHKCENSSAILFLVFTAYRLASVAGAAKAGNKLNESDEIYMVLEPPKELSVEPEDIPLDILYEDEDIIVINKPKQMVVHPAPGHYSGTVVNALLYHCKDSLSGINGVLRPGIVHRIDQDLSLIHI